MDEAAGADVVVINTCAVRENASDRLYGNLGQLASLKQQRPGMQIAVGGCLAQQDRNGIVDRAPYVDVVFGTHNIDVLPVLLERARHNGEAQVEIEEALKTFPSTLPLSTGPANCTRKSGCVLTVLPGAGLICRARTRAWLLPSATTMLAASSPSTRSVTPTQYGRTLTDGWTSIESGEII